MTEEKNDADAPYSTPIDTPEKMWRWDPTKKDFDHVPHCVRTELFAVDIEKAFVGDGWTVYGTRHLYEEVFETQIWNKPGVGFIVEITLHSFTEDVFFERWVDMASFLARMAPLANREDSSNNIQDIKITLKKIEDLTDHIAELVRTRG